ncbi:predicted protein, partial [Nematostella vectensis]
TSHGKGRAWTRLALMQKKLADYIRIIVENKAAMAPARLPRGFPCIISGTVYHTYHPVSASDEAMQEYLTSSLTTIEGPYPGCGTLLSGDFNRLTISHLTAQFKLKQLVKVPTRGERTLDLIITNMSQSYDKDQVKTFPPFGLSDQLVVLMQSTKRSVRNTTSCRTPSVIPGQVADRNWVDISTLSIGPFLIPFMAVSSIRLHINDPPWIIAEFNHLIKLRQKAFAEGDHEQFRRLRNVVNRELHTMDELKLTGNCLKGSRPILSFDEHFDKTPHNVILKEMFIQIFGTPLNHPKSKPFVDRVMTFSIQDNRIWVRNFQ